MAPVPRGPVLPQPRATPGSISDMGFWGEVFPEAMRRLNQEPLPYSGLYQHQWGIRHLSIWPDVQAKLDMARREYDHYNGQQTVGKFRRKLRHALDKAAVPLQQGMKLVPDVEIASPVVGAIDLLLDAYCQAAAVRETVNSGFDDLPETFVRVDFYLKTYPKDDNILKASIDLVLAIFKAIEEAVRFYTSPQAKHAGQAVLSGEEYQKKLLRSLTEISVYSKKLESIVSLSFTHRLISDGNETRHTHAAILHDNWATHQALGAILHGQLDGNKQSAWIAVLLTRLLGVLSDQENNLRPITPTPPPSLLDTQSGGAFPHSPSPGPVHWTPPDLLSHLMSPPLDEIDLQMVLSNAGEAILEHRQRAEQVTATRELYDWLSSPYSYRLLVHGNFDSTDAIDKPVTPLSVLCATLVRTFRVTPMSMGGNRISLVFFCGLHRRNDLYSGGVSMIRSLAQQLLMHFPTQTVQAHPRLDVKKLEMGDLDELCGLFASLMRQLPPGVAVFCVIDGVQEYERDPELLHGMMAVILTLLRLVDECNTPTGGILKLLLVSPGETIELRREFEQVPGGLLHMECLPRI
ncbi:hypothetical protein PG995_005567 [Apiospora arundinis]